MIFPDGNCDCLESTLKLLYMHVYRYMLSYIIIYTVPRGLMACYFSSSPEDISTLFWWEHLHRNIMSSRCKHIASLRLITCLPTVQQLQVSLPIFFSSLTMASNLGQKSIETHPGIHRFSCTKAVTTIRHHPSDQVQLATW